MSRYDLEGLAVAACCSGRNHAVIAAQGRFPGVLILGCLAMPRTMPVAAAAQQVARRSRGGCDKSDQGGAEPQSCGELGQQLPQGGNEVVDVVPHLGDSLAIGT
jgi:hypothetical protein